MINIIELFAGIGAWKKALDNLGIKNNTYAVEKDEDTIKVYNLFYNKYYSKREIQNFSPSENLLKFNPHLIVMSPPCQNYSKAKQCNNRQTDNLISYTLSIIKTSMPRYVVLENVVNFANHKDFQNWKNEMINLGYFITSQILNPLEHNWPQNRPRLFVICFKNEIDYKNYQWPKKESFTYTLNNIIKQGLFSTENYKIKPLPSNAKLRQNGNVYIWGKYIDNRCYLPNRYIGTITATFNSTMIIMWR